MELFVFKDLLNSPVTELVLTMFILMAIALFNELVKYVRRNALILRMAWIMYGSYLFYVLLAISIIIAALRGI